MAKNPGTPYYKTKAIDAALNGNNLILSPRPGTTYRIVGFFLIVTDAVAVTFKDGTTAVTGAMSFNDHGGIAVPLSADPNLFWFEASTLNMNLSSAVQVSGSITYYELED